MNPIIPPLKAGDRGEAVGNLQDALLLLLDRAVIPASEDERRSVTALLQREQKPAPERRAMGILRPRESQQPVYGDGTTKAVALFQQTHQLRPTGHVDEPTANAINAALRELGAIPAGGEATRPAEQGTTRPAQDAAVLPAPRGQDEPAAAGQREANPHSPEGRSRPEQNELVFAVEGTVVSRERAGVAGLKVEIVDKNVGVEIADKNVGGDVRLAEARTGDDGRYRVTFSAADLQKRGKQRPDLQARAFAGQTLLGASDVRYNASNRETLNVLLTAEASSSLPSEHTTLTGTLYANFKGNLRDLKETDDRQDITYLANKTGWDARAVALAALADQFSAKTKDGDRAAAGIEPPFFYALLRAGVGANEDALYQLDAKIAERIWKQAIEQGVISAELQKDIPRAAERFQGLAARRALDGPAVAGLSSLKQMLSVSLGDDPAKQKKFADIYTRHKGDPPKLWEAVRGAFGEAAEKRLRIDGQLGYLTLNNAPLIRKLHAAGGREGLTDTVNLARNGFYRAERWRELIANDAIPAEIAGVNDEEKRARYAELLAAQVRLSFPTMVVAEMVKSGETPVGKDAKKEDVHAFLTEHHGKFEIGMQPVKQYIARNKLQVSGEVSKEITRIQRVYQITPSDGAMNALLKRGLDSALAVSRYGRDQFVRMYRDELGGEANARLTHAKAQEVHNAVFNIATSYLVAGTAPQIGVHSEPPYGATEPVPHAGDVIAYATLEKLVGEMDYCSCEHCRSVLSPAAYLVDLLHFLDRDEKTWTGTETPLQVLLDRRPDIQYLQLTCENTNTPLPYIDLVNETLEYYVVTEPTNPPKSGKPAMSLANYEGHNTDSSSKPEELLASPQFVQDTAYDETLKQALFPPPLPFHQPLESLRRYFDKFETPLPQVMEALRKNDNLERPGSIEDKGYGWRDILMEELRLSRDEYKLLTDRAVTIQQLYGFAPTTSEKEVLFGIWNEGTDDEERFGVSYAKAFTRRVGISYEDIVEILKTRFVNPNLTVVPKLERLHVSLATLKQLKDGAITNAQFEAMLPQGSSAPDPSQYDGNVANWVKNDANYNRIMGLITLVDLSSEKNLCSFDKVEFRYTLPDDAKNKLRPFEFVRLMRFIRLWKKLGWTIEQTDKAITALYPANPLPENPKASEEEKLDAGFLILLPRLGVIKRIMRALKLKPKKDLLPLLACFAPIDTHGPASLYRQMFLSPAPAESPSPFMADEDGNYLSKGVTLEREAERLRAAFLLTDEELNEIAGDLKYDKKTTLLKLGEPAEPKEGAISPIFRRGWLARKLKLSVREFLGLTRITGIDPFAPPDPPDPAYKRLGPPIMRFVDLVNRLRAASLKPEQALYLIWNQDLSGKSAPDQTEILAFARTLRGGFAAVESEFALVDDPDGSIARARMSLVYGNDATTFFFGLLDNTFITEVEYDHEGGSTLEQPILDAAPGRIAYDDFRKLLSFSGVMTKEEHVQKLQSAEAVTQKFRDAVSKDGPGSAPGTGLYHESQKVFGPFFERYPELQPLYEAYTFFGELNNLVKYNQGKKPLDPLVLKAGTNRIAYDSELERLSFKGVMSQDLRDKLRDAAANAPEFAGSVPDFQAAVDKLFEWNGLAIQKFFQDFSARYPDLPLEKEAYLDASDSKELRLKILLATFLPELKRRRKRQQALQAVSAAGKTDIAFASALLDDKTVLYAAAAPSSTPLDDLPPASDDLTAMETTGLSTEFFSDMTATGAPHQTRDAEAILAYSADGPATLPANTKSGIWSGYLEAPENGFYKLKIEPGAENAAGAAAVTVILDGDEKQLTKDGEVWSNTEAIELRAGTLYPIELKVEGITAGLKVKWQTQGRGWEVIPSRYLYSETLTDHLRTVYIRFLKVTALASGLKLTASETVHVAAHPDYWIVPERGWLNSLPVAGNPDSDTAAGLFRAFEALVDFAALKARLSPNDERLLTVLKDPNAAIEKEEDPESPTGKADSLLFTLTRWEEASRGELLKQFGKSIADLAQIKTFRQIYDAFALLKKLGIPASALINAATNEPDGPSVRAFKAALRARYDETDWLAVLRPVNDALRALQRDALVAYILQRISLDPKARHIDTPDKLFEYFLMDVQMDPCMQTSRIRHALSSVQLFIERCFMNLERRVAPEVFLEAHRKQWAWMKRYRVWEANRKVFLWPENWLWPELRDDQSPFFKEAMSELLQSDITEDRAATALLNYLSKLEEVAKLEPCGIHYVEGVPGVSNPVAHVVARTAGANRKYYYRRREGKPEVDAGTWTPWEQIKLDIEDNPVIPVVWKGRFFLFWLRILKQAPMDSQIPENSSAPKQDSGEEKSLADCTPNELKQDAQETAKTSAQVKVQAVLCWSEYYNGKWQQTKTSDINKPTSLGEIIPDALDRSTFNLSARESASGSLVTWINADPESSWFILFNSHSLPLRGEEDTTLEVSSAFSEKNKPFRAFIPGDSFTIRYGIQGKAHDTYLNRSVLKVKDAINYAVIAPHHHLLDPWGAPFFFEDRRHVFYVTTKKQSVLFPNWSGFILGQVPPNWKVDVPILVTNWKPDRAGPIINSDQLGADGPTLIGRSVSREIYIDKAIAMAGSVHFDGTQIGLPGRAIGGKQKQ